MDIRKKIAILIAQPEESNQTRFLKGFVERAFKYDLDVCVFSMFQKYQNSPAREMGDSSIFELIDYPTFDAFVVAIDTIQTPGVDQRIEQRLRDHFTGPVIFLDKEVEGFRSLFLDNINPIKKIISHLIEVHGYKDIAFLTGKSWHEHSQLRLQGYKDAMEEHGLKVNKERIFYGDFWYFSGESVAERLCKSTRGLPEVLACANDCMAIGAAKYLVSKGYKIPDDIAVVGYDTNDEGQHAPVPLTSAPIPMNDFGKYCADSIKALLDGGELSEFVSDVDLFIGSSCGCHNESIKPTFDIRPDWDTEMSQGRVNNAYNHMNEDMLLQSTFNGIINTIFTNTYQIRPFHSLNICLNEDWTTERSEFTDRMLHLIQCGSEGSNSDNLNFLRYYDKKDILSEIHEDFYKPRVFYFYPMHFENMCFGFTSVCYTDPAKVPGQEERTWIRNVILGLEQYRRKDTFVHNNSIIEDRLKREPVTGMYNYSGFVNQADSIIEKTSNFGRNIGVLAIDIKDLSVINNKLGHDAGDHIITALANMVAKVFNGRGSFCFCMGNGEFVAIKLTNENGENVIKSMYDKIIEQVVAYNDKAGEDGKLFVYSAIGGSAPVSSAELELLVNEVINQKNEKKGAKNAAANIKLSADEQRELECVRDILDNNLLTYHFQPIVNASNGEIYSYEALMRADIQPYLSPLKILKYAEHMERLYDVEKATFFNILKIMRERSDVFDGTRKLFINSIPGQRFNEEDREKFIEALGDYDDTVVIEFTEQTEFTDEEIAMMRDDFNGLKLETALDDYGTGYSNISNLLRYRPNYLKIDRMILSGIDENENKQFFVREMIRYAHNNNIKALAEGVETYEELKTVIELGVDLIQGYYTARPNGVIALSIDQKIKDQIKEINDLLKQTDISNVYTAGKEARIMLSQLAENGINLIDVYDAESTFHDFEIIGVPGQMMNIGVHIHSGYSGKIVLDNAFLSYLVGYNAVIVVEDGCDITLTFKGDCSFEGSIYVSEDSSVVFDGDGNVKVYTDRQDYYGIGAGSESRCGSMLFDLTGFLSVECEGMNGIGIGSWDDSEFAIVNGKMKIKLGGQNVVGIGSVTGSSKLTIRDTKIDISSSASNCVAVGAGCGGSAKIDINHIFMTQILEGNRIVGIGTTGEPADVFITKSNIVCNAMGREAVGIGNLNDDGEAAIKIDNAAVTVNTSGNCCAFGTRSQKGKFSAVNARVVCSVDNESDKFIGSIGEDLNITNCDAVLVHNGDRLSMKDLFGLMGRTIGPPPGAPGGPPGGPGGPPPRPI